MTGLFGMQQIEGRKTERYLKAKTALSTSDHYSPWLKKELQRLVKEYEKEQKQKEPQPSTKPKYIGVPDAESSWLLR